MATCTAMDVEAPCKAVIALSLNGMPEGSSQYKLLLQMVYLYAAAQAVAGCLELTNVLLAKSAWALRIWLSASNLVHIGT